MRKIIVMPGDHINHVAARLVADAPACADFNGVPIRARYATTRPGDVVRQYEHVTALRNIAWQHSPEGRQAAERDRAETQRVQAEANATMARLDAVDFGVPASVVEWICAMAGPADRIGVKYDHRAVVDTFTANGWPPGVNCGDEFNSDDARNFAGWIVGQWLANRAPIVTAFAYQWQERFQPNSVN